MEKSRQRYLQQWLMARQGNIRQEIFTNVALGGLSSLVLVGQVFCFATLLQSLIIEKMPREQLLWAFIGLVMSFTLRAFLFYLRERVGFVAGKKMRRQLREEIFKKMNALGAADIHQKPVGSWASLMLEQVENMHNFYARFLPQQYLSVIVPVVILIAVFPLNWAAGLILLITAPLIPLFMILVGIAAADSSQKNMAILAKLSGQFLDRLKGLETLRLFQQTDSQTEHIETTTDAFRESTMDVLKKAFLSSAVLEFFTSISIALMAVYFGFSYLGELNFGSFETSVSLFTGFFCLTLAPEFYQPLRDLGTFYHDRAAAIGSADAIVNFLEQETVLDDTEKSSAPIIEKILQDLTLEARELVVLSPKGTPLTQPLNFTLQPNTLTALVGQSGAGKTSLVNVLLGFLPYKGSFKINGEELRELDKAQWRKQIAWVGQNPMLVEGTIKDNVLLGDNQTKEEILQDALEKAQALDFVEKLGLDFPLNEHSQGLSVGQAQRLAIARALIRKAPLLILDEPTASLDAQSEQSVLESLNAISRAQTTLMITHRIEELKQCEQILVMKQGEIVQQGNFATLSQQGFFAELLKERQEDIQ